MKKTTTKTLNATHNKTSLHNNSLLEDQLQEVNHSLNVFLRKQFKIAISPQSFHTYFQNVQDLFIDLTTSKISTLISSLFSKIGNILQPFISQNYATINQQIRVQIGKYQQKCQKYKQKIKALKLQLQQYNKKSNKIMNFIYMLRLNNINIDKLYELSMENQHNAKKEQKNNSTKQKNDFEQKKNKQLRNEQNSEQISQLSMAFKKKLPIYQNQIKQFNQYHESQKIKVSTTAETNRSKSKKQPGTFQNQEKEKQAK